MSRWSRRTSRRRNSRTASVGVACAAACLAVLGLGGCAEDRLGAAAVVEGRTISTDDLQSATRAHLDLVPGGDAGQAQLAILQRRIVSEVIDEVARDLDVHIRQARVAAERDEVLQSVGGRKGLVRSLAQGQQPTALDPGAVDRWMRDQLLFEKIAAELCDCELAPQSAEAQQAFQQANDALRETSETMDIEVSPRYGSWDSERGITPLVGGGLSKTVDELRDNGS